MVCAEGVLRRPPFPCPLTTRSSFSFPGWTVMIRAMQKGQRAIPTRYFLWMECQFKDRWALSGSGRGWGRGQPAASKFGPFECKRFFLCFIPSVPYTPPQEVRGGGGFLGDLSRPGRPEILAGSQLLFSVKGDTANRRPVELPSTPTPLLCAPLKWGEMNGHVNQTAFFPPPPPASHFSFDLCAPFSDSVPPEFIFHALGHEANVSFKLKSSDLRIKTVNGGSNTHNSEDVVLSFFFFPSRVLAVCSS